LTVAERIATLSRLTSGLGHEISNPACTVLASLEIAEGAVNANKMDDIKGALELAKMGVDAILAVCQALRPLSDQTPQLRTVDVRQVLDSALLLATYDLRSCARVHVDVPADLPLLFADPAKLGQVFLNLLLNAAQATPPGRPSEHQIRAIARAEKHADGQDIVVRIEDTGRGVAPDLLPHLFQPSITTKVAGSGHGMGLAVCKWIVEEMGGTIRCLPDVPRGAVFELRLPVRAKVE